ncbi:hypothetical protein BCR35DRAFT_327477 [Leucosporidium creatinivorum]|uniref:Golgi apparatus membrane protein TVP38 n=1 Tax=Leucosporidium creatinivorum TaxID=106004 RepID=A0A1Y2BZ12_9BASI|nr:hypothetical protein BCR35DRAFT_327477 [Leucosporidium creatinivorum]
MSALLERIRSLPRRAQDYYNSLSSTSRYALWAYVALQVLITGAVIYQGPAEIFAMLAAWAEGLREMYLGWLLLLGLTTLTAFPPLIGYSTCQTIAGFAFGVWHGWFIAVGGCLIGSVLSFTFVRHMIGLFAPMLGRNQTFRAMSTAVRAKGLPLVILIRLCPFPFPYSNAFFASIESVTLFQFIVATICTTPKLLLHVWVGQRTFLFADPDSREKLDPQAKFVNAVYIGVGSVLGFATSYYLYKLTMKYVDEANAAEGEDIEAGLMEDVDELLGEESPDDAEERRPSRAAPAPAPYRDSVDDIQASRRASTMSEDNWGGSISDFGDNEQRRSTDDEDGWGLDTIEETSALETVAVPSKDKRKD